MICGLLVALVLPASASAYVSGGGGLDFEWPADGVVSSPFGPRAGGFHPGLDIGSLRSLDVVAASSGLVVRTGEVPGYDGYGNVVVVDDGGGFTTIYAHLDRPLARTGASSRAERRSASRVALVGVRERIFTSNCATKDGLSTPSSC